MADYLKRETVFEAFGQEFLVLEVDGAGNALCITTRPWRKSFFDDKIERDCTNNINHASIRSLLNYVFLAGLIDTSEDRALFLNMNTDIYDNFGNHDYDFFKSYVRLLTYSEFEKFSSILNIPDWAWTMTPYRCRRISPEVGDQSLAVVDTRGRYGHRKASQSADIYPVVMLSQRVVLHESFLKHRKNCPR